jgi:glycosyltransferase involved in cell wall biosynthesis
MSIPDLYAAYPGLHARCETGQTVSGGETAFAYPAACAYPQPMLSCGQVRRKQPIRVVHVGPSFVCAGVESWLRAISSHCDPGILRFVRNVVTEEYAVDHELLHKTGIPFSFGRDHAVQQAVLEADVVLVWGNVDPRYLRPEGSGARVVFVAHGVGEWTRSALAMAAPVVDHVVAVSTIVREEVCGGFPTTVILNGVDQRHIACRESREEMRRRLGFTQEDFVVGFSGRFSPEKNAHLMIEACEKVQPGAKALLVGWGPLRYQLMDLCNERIPGRFAFAMARDFLGDFYQVMDALCMPSEAEGFGLVAAEAMLHGVPVVSTPVGIAHELFDHRVNGLLSRADSGEIADNLKLLQQNRHWARGIGAEGRKSALQHCLASTMAGRYEQLLESLVDGKAIGG